MKLLDYFALNNDMYIQLCCLIILNIYIIELQTLKKIHSKHTPLYDFKYIYKNKVKPILSSFPLYR